MGLSNVFSDQSSLKYSVLYSEWPGEQLCVLLAEKLIFKENKFLGIFKYIGLNVNDCNENLIGCNISPF